TQGAALARLDRRLEPAERLPQEPRLERAVEDVDLLPPRDEVRAERPVDVVAGGQVDDVEAAQRVGDPAGADLEPPPPEHAPEGDDVPDDRRASRLQPAPPRPARRARRPERPGGPRGA